MTSDVVVVGSANHDLTVAVERMPAPGETVLGGAASGGPGGKGLNQAVASARLGRSTALVGAVGDDPAGHELRELLATEGVDPALATATEPTGLAQVFVDSGGESTIVVSPGANHALTPEWVNHHREAVSNARAVLCQLEVPVPVVAAAFRHARGLRALNPAPGQQLPLELLGLVDLLIPNLAELAALTAGPHLDRNATTAATHAARNALAPAGRVVVTLGERGALATDGDSLAMVPAAPLQPGTAAVDATGAGDTFCAALVDALLGEATIIEATRWACAAAAVTVTRPGAAVASPTRAEVLRSTPPPI